MNDLSNHNFRFREEPREKIFNKFEKYFSDDEILKREFKQWEFRKIPNLFVLKDLKSHVLIIRSKFLKKRNLICPSKIISLSKNSQFQEYLFDKLENKIIKMKFSSSENNNEHKQGILKLRKNKLKIYEKFLCFELYLKTIYFEECIKVFNVAQHIIIYLK